MALSANATGPVVRDRNQQAWEAVNSAEIYFGGYAMVGTRSHATTATRGRTQAWNDENGAAPAGFFTTRETGNTSGTPVPTGKVSIDGGIHEVSVTGAGAVSDAGLAYVYATDDNTFTLTRPTLGIPIGSVVEYKSGTTCMVYMFSLGELIVMAAGGNAQETICLGQLTFVSGISDGNVLTGWQAPYHAQILDFYCITDRPIQGDGSGATSLNLEIGGTNVTDGVITISETSNDVAGEKNSASAITGADIMHEGDLIDVEAASSAGNFTAGSVRLYIEVLKLPGV